MKKFIIRHEKMSIASIYQSDFQKLWDGDCNHFQTKPFQKIKEYIEKQEQTGHQYYFPLKYWKLENQQSTYQYGVFDYYVEYIKASSVSEFIEFIIYELLPIIIDVGE